MAKLNIKQTMCYHDYYSRLKSIALSIFKWEGLPESCNARFLEVTLFNYGHAIFIDDPDTGFLNLKCTPASTLNPYNEPTAYTAYSTGYDAKIFNADDCVYIRNNYLSKSTDSTIMLFAERLASLEMTIQTNIHAQKTPILIRCDDKTKRSLEEIYNQYSADRPKIVVHKSLNDKPFEVVKTDAPFVANLLRDEKRAVWNDALEFLGINTNPSDKKKERLIVSEVDSNNEQIDIQCLTMFLCRQEACERINDKYGLNVKVSMRVEEFKKLRLPEPIERSVENGTV